MANAQPVLQCRGVAAAYDSIRALHDVSLDVRPGEIVAVIGANGAGKTTLMRAIMGFVPVLRGEVLFDGEDVSRQRPHQMARSGVAYVPEGRELFPSLTVAENLAMGRVALPAGEDSGDDLAAAFERFPVLADRRQQRAGTLSGGEQQMLAMARALVSRPKLCLMDEPSLGLAPKLQEEIFEIVASFRRDGVSVLLVEQNARRALQVCDRAWVLEVGTVVRSGTGEELATDTDIEAAYFGRSRTNEPVEEV